MLRVERGEREGESGEGLGTCRYWWEVERCKVEWVTRVDAGSMLGVGKGEEQVEAVTTYSWSRASFCTIQRIVSYAQRLRITASS